MKVAKFFSPQIWRAGTASVTTIAKPPKTAPATKYGGKMVVCQPGSWLTAKSKDTTEWTVPAGAGTGNPGFAAPVAMPDFGAQPVSQPAAQPAYAAPVAMPDFNAQPVVAQPDPARDYYNSLLAQGYPHDDAVRYTQQYFQQFQG